MQMRIGSFNVENLFDRAKALNHKNWSEGAPVLAAQAELNKLLERDVYTDANKDRMIELLGVLKLLRNDESTYVRLRKIRGTFLRRPKDKTTPVTVVAKGRADWIGWVELIDEAVDQLATTHTAMAIRDINADILGVVEAESRPVLQMFSTAMLKKVNADPYRQVMLVDGNDDRGIDVGLMVRPKYPIVAIRTHIFDTDSQGIVFSRDCCEYDLDIGGGDRLVVLMNHLKSKGYSSPGDPIGALRRERQATRIAAIYNQLIKDGAKYVAVLGDFNDDPSSTALKPLLSGTDLRDISEHTNFEPGPRDGTFGSGGIKDKIDYVLLSPKLFKKATGGAVFRKGVWRGERTKNKWEIYDTLTADSHAASDHAAIYADLNLG
jgi:endonuclease/exonuclease/phosphatase family metal-dependent hydrolase